MKKLRIIIPVALLGFAFFLGACGVRQPSLETRYREAVRDAVFAGLGEVRTNLTPITETNQNLSWKDKHILTQWKHITIC